MLFCVLSRQRAPAAKELRPGEDDRFVENAKRPPVVLEVAVNRRRGAVVVIAAADGDAVLPGDVRLFLASVSLIDDDVVVVVAAAATSGPAGGAMPTIIEPLLDKTGAIVLVQGESEAAEVALVEQAEVVFMVETTAAVRCAAGGKQVADGGVA